ncbi:MAG: CARDB domain-containing protein [Pseudomonadota bacterium]
MSIPLENKNKSFHLKLIFSLLLFLILMLSSPGFAFELLTFNSTDLQYTYYLNAAGEKVIHGTKTSWYPYPNRAISQRIQYSHGVQHGLDEAWYVPGVNGYVKHWERNYQNGVLHGLSKEWSQIAGVVQAITNYRYGVLNGPYQRWKNTYDYYHMIENANYKDGLLDGPYKKWIVRSYTFYGYTYKNQQILDQEGSYAYGKMNGYWKFYWSSESYPYYTKEEGSYGNGNKCGNWKYYFSTTGGLSSTVPEGNCQDAIPPGGGGPLPPGKSFEIRGHVYDNDTNAPLANATLQAGNSDSTTDETGFYAIVLDSGDVYTLNCVLDAYYNYSKTVDMTTAQYVTVDIGMKRKEPGEKPAITNVDTVNGNFFIEGLSTNNDYVVSVDWMGDAPGKVIFEVNGTEYETSAGQTGATYSFDMGSDFKGSLSPTGNTLKITAINYSGVASNPESLNPVVIPMPDWSVNFGNGFEIKTENNHLVYKLDMDWPEEPIEILVDENELGSILWQAWGLFPYIGGRVFGIPGTQAFFELEAKTDGNGSIAAGGKSGFKAAGGEIEIKLGAKGNLKYEDNKGLEWKETSLILGVKGTLEKQVGPVTIIPALEGAVNLPLIGGAVGWFNDRAKIKGTITTGSEMALEVMSATGEIGFNRADIETNAGIGLGMSIEIIEDLEAEVTGGGTGKIFWQVPADPDYFKKLEASLTADIKFSIMGWEWTTGYTHPFVYPGTTTQSMARNIPSYTMTPVSREFLAYGKYNRPVEFANRSSLDIGGTGPTSNYQIIENVFPYSDPAIAEYNGNAVIAYVYLDPEDPVHQETEIYYSFFNGTNYTSPAPIFDDTRADFSPSIAYDSDGKTICAWQRVKNDNFQGQAITDMVPELEIVYSVYDPAADTPAWSEPVSLTDNTFMDYNPMLRRGADGSLMLVWLSNSENRLIGNSAAPTSIHYTRWNGTEFANIATLATTLENSFKFSFAYNGTKGILTYTKDMDGIFVAPQGAVEPAASDQEIFYLEFDGSSWGIPKRVTSDNTADTASQVIYTASGPELVWLRGDTLVRLTTWDTYELETIKSNILSAGLTDFKFYSDSSGHLVLVWQESDDQGVDLFYAVYDNDHSIWSNDLRLTSDPEMEKAFSGQFDNDGMLHLVFNKKDMDTQATGLFHMTYELDVDLLMPSDSISMDMVSPLPGDNITLTAKVLNQGDLSVIDSSVSFYLGDPASSGVLIGNIAITPASLKAGEAGEASLPWTIPADITDYMIYAVVDPDNATIESDETNNTAQFNIIKPDLEADHCRLDQKPDGSYHVVGTIINHGILDATDVDVLFKAEENIIGTMVIPSILAGKTAQVSFPASLAYYNYTSWNPQISFSIDADNKIAETNEANNTASTVYTLEILSPSAYHFENVPYKGAIQTITIFNKTQIQMVIGDIILAGQDAAAFTIIDAPCKNGMIPAQTSCVIGVQCLPSSLGIKKAELLINSDQGNLLGSMSLTGELDHLLLGDINSSGGIDIVDAMMALKLATGLTETQIYLIVDTDKDGRISINEATFALQKNADVRP